MSIEQALNALGELEDGMKTTEFEMEMGNLKLNSSFALLGVEALEAYLAGDVAGALDDFETLATEIAARSRRRAAGEM